MERRSSQTALTGAAALAWHLVFLKPLEKIERLVRIDGSRLLWTNFG